MTMKPCLHVSRYGVMTYRPIEQGAIEICHIIPSHLMADQICRRAFAGTHQRALQIITMYMQTIYTVLAHCHAELCG